MKRRRPLMWLLLSVACFIAAFYFWRLGDKSQVKRPGPAAATNPAAPAAAAPAATSQGRLTNSLTKHASTAPIVELNPPATNAVTPRPTNASPYRLSNTAQTVGQLSRNSKAILLENALIDLSEPVNLAIPDSLRAHGEPGAYVVQADGAINNAFRSQLKAAGLTIVSYIPNNAFLVTGPPAAVAQFGSRAIPWEPYYKIKSSLMKAALTGRSVPAANVLVFDQQVEATVASLNNMGVVVASQSQSPFGTELNLQNVSSVAGVAGLPGIEEIEPSAPRVLNNDLSRVIMSVSSDVFVPTNYMFLTGSNVLVAVNDSWVPTNFFNPSDFNPDLQNIFGPSNVYSFSTGGGIADFDGHATHVAGIIAASGQHSPANVVGSPPLSDCRGKAPLADIWALPLHGLSDRQLQEDAALTNALISNNSWGYGTSDYNLAAASYDQAVRDSLPGGTGSQSIVYVFAAGNSGGGGDDGLGGTPDTLLSPAVAKNVISVGATELPRGITNMVTQCDVCTTNCNTFQPWLGETDSSNEVARFSSRGNVGIGIEGDFGRFKPDLVAPGTFVVSTRSMTWDTNAYYNPTNFIGEDFPDALITPTNSFDNAVSVPCDAVQFSVSANSINPNNVDLPIYVQVNSKASPSSFVASGMNFVSLPPDAALTPTDTFWYYSVVDPTNVPVICDISDELVTTNDFGDYFDILRTNLNDQLVTTNGDGPFYRYETGTSMSAAAVSGVLALMEDYFTNQWHYTPSPALMKALLINGARSMSEQYDFQVQNTVNIQGWGLVNLTNSLPVDLTNSTTASPAPMFFVDQDTNNALATGDSRTFMVSVNPTNGAQSLPLRITLVWTDPPGNPLASIKLVNNLDLIVTNLDSTNGPVFFGNDIPAGNTVNNAFDPTDTNAVPNVDNINNVENVYIPQPLGSNYSITVFGREVNVNAVTANTNGIVQDFALVVSSDNGEITNALTFTSNPTLSSYTTNLTIMTNEFPTSTDVSGELLLNQHVGASSPLQGTNLLSLGSTNNQDNWGTNGQITVGVSNQWHFYVIANTNSSGSFTNAAFITFLPVDLSIPPVGVNAPNLFDSTRPEADIDLYVARASVIPNASDLLNLDPTVVAAADKSLLRGGTEMIVYSNAQPDEVFYIGVKSEDQEAAEYGFAGLFSRLPFSQMGTNGEEYIQGINVPTMIPDGSPSLPGVGRTLALAVQPIEVRRVVVTNIMTHQNFGDLQGTLSHSGNSAVLNNHTYGNGGTNQTLVYEDNGEGNVPNSQHTDGPGSLMNFVGHQGLGLWMLTEVDNAIFNTGQVDNVFIKLEPQQGSNGVVATIAPNTFFYDFIDVPPEATNLTVCVSYDPQSGIGLPLDLFLRYGDFPTLTTFDYTKVINPPGDCLSVDRTDLPPLRPGRYYVGIYNPNSVAQTVRLTWTFGLDINGANPGIIISTNVPAPLLEDAVTNSTILITNDQKIVSVNVGVVLTDPRISDLDLTLISPTGQRILLMENRGGCCTTNLGHLNITTNFLGTFSSGGPVQTNNILTNIPPQGILIIDYQMYQVPDQLDVYDDVGNHLFHSGYVSGPGTFTIPYGPGVTSLTIVMNQGNNPVGTTAWYYTPFIVTEDFTYLTFTDDTNLTQIPIKYAIPPYDSGDNGTNIILGDFDLAASSNYFATPNSPTNFIPDNSGGWSLTTNNVFVLPTNYYTGTNLISMGTNMVTVFTDPLTAFNGSNVLALANGSISRVLSLTPQKNYTINYFYRGPGIGGWWRGEGNASDSADPETLGNNGYLIGRFNFPAGEVGQAFAMEDSGLAFQFAGTNTYVQVRQSPTVDVGSNSSGFTVEGWIYPTNTTFQQPLAEWLAGLPMSSNAILGQVDGTRLTNFNIVAGPFRNPANNHYYYLLGQTNWTTSEYWAEAMGGHLAQVNDANEENWIYDTFATWGLTNHTMWIGLTNASLTGTNFVWSTGSSNLVYTNWAAGQPTNCSGAGGEAAYVAILGPTNALPGLWTVLNNDGVSCRGVTNKPFGVVEVNQIQTNGVQLWISVTNSVTNNDLTGLGRLYANIMDTNNVPHEVFSAPGLIQSNIFQHVALTYNTNTGVANLYYEGTNVASTNLGIFVPNTTGDLLLGKDMSTVSNNFFWGRMDEMSIYSRYLSDAEIAAIYNVSASTTNRDIGKFNPAIAPALGLAEAQVVFGNATNFLLAVNDSWHAGGFTIKPTSNTLPVQITGLEPGVLLDAFSISEQPPGNLYYLPEQALNALVGSNALGPWTLEIRDSRTGEISTNADLISWELQFILETNTPTPIQLNPQTPAANTIPPGEVGYFVVNVPSWAIAATNILVSSTNISGGPAPVSLLFNQTAPPLSGSGTDFTFVNNNTTGSATISNQAPSNPLLLPGQSYYLAVTNAGTQPAIVDVEVDFNITTLSNGVPFTGSFSTNDLERPFVFYVTTNATEATFQLMQLTGNADLVLRKGLPLPSLTSADYGAFSGSNSDETIYVLTNSAPVPLSAGPWYLDVIKRETMSPDNSTNIIGAAMRYAVLAKELDPQIAPPVPNIIDLTNRVPFTWTAGPGTALTNFFRFSSNNFSSVVPTNIGLHFELYNQTGNGDLTVQTDAPPLYPPFFQSSRLPGNAAEFIFIHTNSAFITNLGGFTLTNLATDWYLGVPNDETNPIKYTIIGVIDTNVFPSFPAAEGAGSDTRGGAFGTNVYHVINLSDSGLGSLRYGVSQTNGAQTIVFDVAGTINLNSPLYITNSNITIAGQTAPPGGITISGASTYVQNAHDVILRYLRFRPQSSGIDINGSFETPPAGPTYSAPATFGGWSVTAGTVDAVPTWPPGWQTADGIVSLDLNGTTPGTISRAVPTIPGKIYTLRFAYSANPDGGISPKTMQVSWGGSLLGTISAFTNGVTHTNMHWIYTNFTVLGHGSDLLQFKSTTTTGPTQFGPTLDAVSVTYGTNTSLQVTNSSSIIIDHVSSEYAANDDLSVLNSSNVTVQWSMLANSQNQTNYLAGGSEVRYGAGEVTLHHNLYANNYSASPRIGDDITLDFVNNVIFNWGVFAGVSTNDIADDPGGFTNYLNYSANYAIAWTNSIFTNVAFWGGTTNTWIFQTDNVIDTNLNFILDGANTSWGMFSNLYTSNSAPFIIQPTAPDEAFIAYERVLDFAGTAIGRRDGTDRGIVQQVRFEPVNTSTTPGFLSGMVAWWKAESNFLDSSGFNNNGTPLGGQGFAPGEVGLAFNVTNSSQGVEVPSSSSLVVSNITIEGWINPTYVGNYRPVIEYGGDSGGASPIMIQIGWNNNSGTSPGTLSGLFRLGTSGGLPLDSTAGLVPINQWSHVALTFDYASQTGCLYFNGTKVASGVPTGGTLNTATNLPVHIGYRANNSGEAFPGTRFPGELDEFSIYNRALSQCEIQAIYNSGTNGKAPLLAGGTNLVFSPNPPFKDVDQDGIPDFWEMTLPGEFPTNFSAYFDRDGDGYTDLEEYMNWLAGPHALTVTNNPVAVDLYSIAGNTGNLVFGVANGTNGTVYLTNSSAVCGSLANNIAIFTPTNNFGGGSNGGFGSFSFMVTNMDTVAYFGPVTVSVFCSSVPITNANVAPFIFTNPPDITILELTTNQVLNAAIPTNGITYTLPPSDPPWVTINTNTGLITLTPGECVGSNIYTIYTVAQDTNVPPDFATNQFNVTVLETNLAPYFTNNPPYVSNTPPNITNYALATIVVTNGAADADCPTEVTLTNYQVFIAGAFPASNLVNNASIDANGVITWTPTPAQTGLWTVTTIVTDYDPTAANSPTLSATNVFYIMVLAPPLPAAFTQPAQAVLGTSALLNGMATPGGYPSTAWFQWGTSTSYGNQTPPVSVGSGFNVVYTNAVITGLSPNVPYHFRLVLSNALGIVTGFDQIFDEAYVAGWGGNYVGQISIPPGLSNVVAIAGAYDHSMALLNNETVLAWGDNTASQTNVPASLNNALAIAGGQYYSMALRNNGTVTSWGADLIGQQTNVPPGLTNPVMIAGGTYASYALQSSGRIVAWGANLFGLTNVPVGLSNVVEVAGGTYHAVAIKNDGTLVAWGDNSAGETNIPASATNVVQIACGGLHSLALRGDGTVVAWGDNSDGQTVVPPGLSNVVAVAAGDFHSMALRSDGTIAAWGNDSTGQSSVPVGLNNVVAISAGHLHSLALTTVPYSSSTNIVILPITNCVPETNTVFAGQTVFYRVNVPGNADFDTNSLFPVSGGNLSVWFTTNTPPSVANVNDFLLIGNTNAGAAILSNSGSPQLIDSTTYYLGVQNTNSFSVSYAIEVDFHFVITSPATNTSPVSIIHTNINGTNGFLLTWFAPSNDLFQVQWSSNLPPAWNTFTNPPAISYDTNYAFVNATNTEFDFFDDGSQTGGFSPSRFYRVILLNGTAPATVLSNGVPQTNGIPPGTTVFYQINVPTNALFATNSLLFTQGDPGDNLNIWFSTNSPPTISNSNDFLLLTNATSGSSVLGTNGSPNIIDGGTYYLGVQNTSDCSVAYGLVVNFDLIGTGPATNTVPISGVTSTNIGGTNGFLLVWFAPSNDLFQVQWTTNLPGGWTTFPVPPSVAYDPSYPFINATNTRFEFFDDGSQTGGLSPWRYYRLILLNGSAAPLAIPLTNGVPLNYATAAGGTNFFSFTVTQTNAAVLFELYNLTGNGNLNLQVSNLPTTPPYFTNSGSPGTNYQQIVLRTNGALPNINAISWFLGVPNQTGTSINYTIRAVLPTNGMLISGLPFNTLVSQSGGTNLQLSWSPTVSGEMYEVRTNSNLASTNWGALTDILATGTSINFTDPTPIGAIPDLFFRVVQVP